MSVYKYKALVEDGTQKDGSILADSYKCAYSALRRKKYQPIQIKKIFFVSRKVNLEDLLLFFMHIDFQLKCGANINEAIESFIDSHGNKILNASLLDVLDALKNGESISSSFEKCSPIFDNVIIGLLKSAEKTGKISDAISNILEFIKLQSDWKNNVKRAIAYPTFIAIVAILVLVLSVGILGPQVVSLTQGFGNEQLPILTKFAIEFLPRISASCCVFLFVSAFAVLLLSANQKGRKILSEVILKIPKIGQLITKITLWQFCKILHISLNAKLDFVQGLKLAIEGVQFRKDELKKILDYLVDGHKISESFSQAKFIPSGLIMSVYVGEEGNNLASGFQHISEVQYKEILFHIKSFGQFLSVGLTIFTGLIFVFILCSLFYPIYSYIEIAGL